MRIIFVEFEWQAIKIISDKKFLESDIIISLDSTSSYIFKKKHSQLFDNTKYDLCFNQIWEKIKS